MDTLTELFSTSAAQRVGWALIHSHAPASVLQGRRRPGEGGTQQRPGFAVRRTSRRRAVGTRRRGFRRLRDAGCLDRPQSD